MGARTRRGRASTAQAANSTKRKTGRYSARAHFWNTLPVNSTAPPKRNTASGPFAAARPLPPHKAAITATEAARPASCTAEGTSPHKRAEQRMGTRMPSRW